MAAGKLRKIFAENLGRNNPVLVQILGICSTLAVTNYLRTTVVMCLGLVYVTTLSNLTVSLLRKRIPARIRMMVEVMIIAAFVIVVDILLKAFLPDMSRRLGPYVGLIITNCIVMGRTEAFALANPPLPSLVDGFSAGLGYSYVLLIIAFVRELMGSGTLWGIRVMGAWWENWAIMAMAPSAFFLLAAFIWIMRGTLLKPKTGQEGKP